MHDAQNTLQCLGMAALTPQGSDSQGTTLRALPSIATLELIQMLGSSSAGHASNQALFLAHFPV
jgi:hypothetical protein